MPLTNEKKLMKSGFGRWGWVIIIMCLLTYFLGGVTVSDGLNIYVGGLSELRGWDRAEMLSMSTYGGWIGVVTTLLFAQFVARKRNGAKLIMVAGLFVAAIAMFTYGHSASFGGYAVSVIVASVSYTGYGMVAPNTIQTNWFPKKKALALGVSTIGFPLATMVFPITANWVIGKLGLGGLFTSISVFIIVVAIFVIFLVKTYPEERGVEPDNLPQDSTSVSENTVAEVKILSLAEVAKTKQVWLISIGLGLLWLVTVGIVSQFVNRMLTAGYDRTGAVQLMALMGFFGIFGSYLWGLIDQKIGTKKASIIYAAWYMVGLLLLIFMQSTVVIYLAVFMVGIGVGGICNLIPSYVGTIYGRENFASANRIVAPLTGLVKSTAYLYMGYSSRITGNLIGSYVGLIVICIIAGLLICFVKPLEKTN